MKITDELISSIRRTNIIDFSSYHPMIINTKLNELVTALKKVNAFVKKIMLNENVLNDDGIEALSDLDEVELLCVSMNKLTDNSAQFISKMKSLTALDIAENEITDNGMSKIIINLKNLKSLTFTSESFGPKTINAILEHSNLEEVVIFDDENIDSKVLEKIEKHAESNRERNKAKKTELTNNRKTQFF